MNNKSKEVDEIEERAELLVTRPGLFERIESVSVFVWLSILPLLILIYASWIAIWQRGHQPEIRATATYIASIMSNAIPIAPTYTPTPIP
jgi:hypothetical protein